MAITPKKPVRSSAGGKSGISQKSINNFKKQTTMKINSLCLNYAKNVTKNLVRAYALGVKSRLIEEGFKQSGDYFNGQRIVINLAKTIRYDDTQAFIPVDRHGLMLYLEYGTGLVGAENSTGYAERHGWNYAINKKKYKRVSDYNPFKSVYSQNGYNDYFGDDYIPFTTKLGHKLGFTFQKSPVSFVTKDDVDPVPFKSRKIYYYKEERWRYTKSYVRGNGVKVRGYRSKIKNKNAGKFKVYDYDYTDRYGLVWSAGIKPMLFIYKTKRILKNVLKKTDFNGFYSSTSKSGKPYTANLDFKVLSDKAIKTLNRIANGDWSKGEQRWV